MKPSSQVNTPKNTTQNQNPNVAKNPLQRGTSPFGINNNVNAKSPTQNNNKNSNSTQNTRNGNVNQSNRNSNVNQSNNTRTNTNTQVNQRANTRQQTQSNKKGNDPASTQQAVSQIIKNVINTKQYTNAPATNYSHPVQPTVQNNKSGGNSNMNNNTSASSSDINKASVFDNPVFKGIEPAKMAFIKDMISEMEGKKQEAKPQLLMTYVMRMRKEGFSFTPEELGAVTAALRPTMSDEENKQFDNFTTLMKNMYR
jgi:hypothetical protein